MRHGPIIELASQYLRNYLLQDQEPMPELFKYIRRKKWRKKYVSDSNPSLIVQKLDHNIGF
jgi:hypothetical protein